MKMRAVTLAALSLGLVASGCGITPADQVTLVRKGTLTVCTAPDRGLFARASRADPRGFTGFDVEVASAVARRMKLHIKVLGTPAGEIGDGTAVNAGRCDVAIGALAVTGPNGDSPMLLSTPYYTPALALLTRPSSGLGTLGDLDRHRVGVLSHDAAATRLLQAGAPHARPVRFANLARLHTAFRAHRVDAVLADLALVVGLTDHTATIVEKYPGTQHLALGVKTGSVALLAKLNTAIAAFVTSDAYRRTYELYFGAR